MIQWAISRKTEHKVLYYPQRLYVVHSHLFFEKKKWGEDIVHGHVKTCLIYICILIIR